jgi:hypothetical protein
MHPSCSTASDRKSASGTTAHELRKRIVTAFLSSLAARSVSASTQNQALSALLFLYEVVQADLAAGRGSVALPNALRGKYPNAPREWAWQWVFPATRFYVDAETKERRRHHLHESVLQRAVKDAVRAAGIPHLATCHSLRHHADSRIMPMMKWPSSIASSFMRSADVGPLVHAA